MPECVNILIPRWIKVKLIFEEEATMTSRFKGLVEPRIVT